MFIAYCHVATHSASGRPELQSKGELSLLKGMLPYDKQNQKPEGLVQTKIRKEVTA